MEIMMTTSGAANAFFKRAAARAGGAEQTRG